MPGYILHLTSARMFLDRLPVDSRYRNDLKVQNDFYIGNLLPDAVSPKESSHFYDSVFRDRMIVWPRPEKFLDKYRDRLEDPFFWGYFYHLYIDKKFLQEYLPGRVEYYDCRGQWKNCSNFWSTQRTRQSDYFDALKFLKTVCILFFICA